jgi:hypothetical protein
VYQKGSQKKSVQALCYGACTDSCQSTQLIFKVKVAVVVMVAVTES